MRTSTPRRFVVTMALLGLALLCGAGRHALAADATRDVQVNLDVLDSLGPSPDAAAGPIHLHAPRPKINTAPAVATAAKTPVAAPPHESAAAPAVENAAAAAPHSASGDSPPAAAPPAPMLMPAPLPAPAVTAAAPPHDSAAAPAVKSAAASAPPGIGSDSPPAAAPPARAPAPVTAMNAPPLAVKPPATSIAPAAAPKTPAPSPTRLLFTAGAADLPDVAKPKLDALAEWLDDHQQARIEVAAYAAGGAEQANDARRMSLTRALAVRSYLAQHGVATSRMEVRALGNHSAEGDPPDRVDIAMMDR